MAPQIVKTKFYIPPIPENLVPRARLMERLHQGIHCPITLVSAPPGYGKTTLLAEWCRSLGSDVPTAWLSLDTEDNDHFRFLFYLVSTIEGVCGEVLNNTMLLLQASPPAPRAAVLASLINELNALTGLVDCPPHDLVLVIDDYYLITNRDIHDALAYLVDHLPRSVHLVILTREDPPIPIAKLRVRREMQEIRAVDLRFSAGEVGSFLSRSLGMQLSEPAITTLLERTEGWVAGLQMASLAMAGMRALEPGFAPKQFSQLCESFIAEFRGDDRYIMDFLMEEVFQRQPQEIQDFLLQTSILKRLNASLCEDVLRDQGIGEEGLAAPRDSSTISSSGLLHSAQETLEYLEKANLFIIPLDNKREWYRYHHLFAELLSFRLQRVYPERLPELHRRAYRWCVHSQELEEAMSHALAIPDHDLAADLAEGFLQQMIRTSHISACLSWIQRLTDEAVRSRAYLSVSCAWAYILNGDTETSRRYLGYCEAALESYRPAYLPSERRRISLAEVRGHISAVRAFEARWRGDFPQAMAFSHQSLQELPTQATDIRSVVALNLGIIYLALWEPDMAWKYQLEAYQLARESRKNLFVAVTALGQLAGIALWQGKLQEAERRCREAIQMSLQKSTQRVSVPAVAYAHGWLSAVHNQRGEAEAALDQMEKALKLIELVGPLASEIYARLFQARLALDAGEFGKAEVSLNWAEEKSRNYPLVGPLKTEWIVNRGRLFLEHGEVLAAIQWVQSQGVQANDLAGEPNLLADALRPLRTCLPEYLLLARAYLAQGNLSQAEQLLERICAAAEAWQYGESLLEGLVLRAVAAAGRDRGIDLSAGLPYLERALHLAAPEGYVRPFLQAGRQVEKLLRQAIVQDIQPAYAQKLLGDLAEQDRRQARQVSFHPGAGRETTGDPDLVEPLTERERQVLRLLAAGLNSTQVAEELVISVSTARSYIKNIYAKLDAHSRLEAIDKAVALKII